MSMMRIHVAVYATVLLAAGLGSEFARAEGRLAGIKSRFSGQKVSDQKVSDQSYAIFADLLHQATESDQLAENTEAAKSLLGQHADGEEGVEQLVQAFGALISDSSNPESFCSKDNLANLLRVVEGMRDGGNLGPSTITAAVLRLNRMVIDVVGDAREVCDPYLTGRWPKPWQPKFSDEAMRLRIKPLYTVANSFTYEGFTEDYNQAADYQPDTMSYIIKRGEREAAKPIDPDEPDLLKTANTTVIAMQLDEYVYKPCSEFVGFDEVKDVLVPFNDLHKIAFVVSSRLLNEYYKNQAAHVRYVSTDDSNLEARYLAYSYQACQRFLATPKEDLAERISYYRLPPIVPEPKHRALPIRVVRKIKNQLKHQLA